MIQKQQISLCFLIIVCLGACFPVCALAMDTPRQTINFNREWKYVRGDYQPSAESVI